MKSEVLKQVIAGSHSSELKFPQVVGMLLEQGVEAYHVDFVRNENRYYNAHGESEALPFPHRAPKAAKDFSAEAVSAAIKKSQQGLINYLTFVDEVTKAGCVYYIAYLAGRQVIYFGRNGDFHVEKFPNK